MNEKNRKVILALALVAIVGAIVYFESQKADVPSGISKDASFTLSTKDDMKPRTIGETDTTETQARIEAKRKKYEVGKELTSIAGYINVEEGFTLQPFIGKKVVLIDFWTYSCINCQRTLPYITSWYDKYKDQGLVVVGVHTPEFKFEQEYDNVVAAAKQWGITYPVVQDNDYGTWRAYGNRYWPRKYLIDIDGFIVFDHIGEGGYTETERKIQELLKERREVLGETTDIATDITKPTGVEDVDVTKPRSPETYFGSARNNRFGNGTQGATGRQSLTEPSGLKTHIFYLDGGWYFDPEYAENTSAGAKIIYRYQAAKVFLVARSDKGIRARILIDGEPAGERAGADVDADGYVTFKDDRLYRLVEDPNGWGEHTLEIIIESPGVQIFAFTFG